MTAWLSLLPILCTALGATPMSEYRKPSLDELRKKLTPEQYTCTQEEGTERPFENPYWALKDDGLYVDVVSGEPLFSSLDKYDSGTGWPSFTKPIEDHHLQFKKDSKLGVTRTEVRSQGADSHLGHVFDDGPKEAGGKRFCMNSAALKFIPLSEMKRAGYGKFLFPFAKKKNWEIATLAGGCFWGMEALLEKLPGVIETQAGYTGGALKKATYKDVKTGTTGHAEAVQILFDPAKTTFEAILLEFFRLHDPTTPNQQGGDKGTQYRSAIFFHSADQEKTAKAVKTRVAVSGKWGLDKPIVTEIVAATEFWRAEEDHQKYLQKTPRGYTCHYVRDFKF